MPDQGCPGLHALAGQLLDLFVFAAVQQLAAASMPKHARTPNAHPLRAGFLGTNNCKGL